MSKKKEKETRAMAQADFEDPACQRKDELVFGTLNQGVDALRFTLSDAFYCWGRGSGVPTPFYGLRQQRIKQVRCGGRHFLALTEDGVVYSWGSGSSGQLGHGGFTDEPSPRQVEGLADSCFIQQIEAAAAQSAAITERGELYIWGWKGEGRGDPIPQEEKSLEGKSVLSVALGAYHTMALVAVMGGMREVYTWGAGNTGQLGHGDLRAKSAPTKIAALDDVVVIGLACGDEVSAAVTLYGDVYIWGRNEYGLLGVQSTTKAICTPMMVEGFSGVNVVKLEVGVASCIAISDTGDVFTWGKNAEGQLGHGTTEDVEFPRRVKTLSEKGVHGAAVGHNHMLAWTRNGEIYSWGSNRDERLGLSCSVGAVTTPTVIESLRGRAVFDLSAGSRSVIACLGKPIFGLPLKDCVDSGNTIPRLVEEIVTYLNDHVGEEGLFRISPPKSQTEALVGLWDSGYHVSMRRCPDAHLAAQLLKRFLSSLPDPLLTFRLQDQILALQAGSIDFTLRLEGLRLILTRIPQLNRENSVSMLNALAALLCNEKLSIAEMDSMRKKVWSSWVTHLADPKPKFRDTINKLCTFRTLFYQSDAIERSIESALIRFPKDESLSFFRNILSHLKGITCDEAQGSERGELRLVTPQPPSPSGSGNSLEKNVPERTNDEVLAMKMWDLAKAARTIGGWEKQWFPSQRALMAVTAASTDSVFAEMDQEENRVKNELSNLSNDLEAVRNKKLETTSIGQEESQIFVKIGALKREINENKRQLESTEQALAQAKRKMLDMEKTKTRQERRYRDEVEGLGVNLSRKKELLNLYNTGIDDFQAFLEQQYYPHHHRLEMRTQELDLSEKSKHVDLLDAMLAFMEVSEDLIKDLQTGLKRVRRDLRRMTKSYKSKVLEPIRKDYDKQKRRFVEAEEQIYNVLGQTGACIEQMDQSDVAVSVKLEAVSQRQAELEGLIRAVRKKNHLDRGGAGSKSSKESKKEGSKKEKAEE